MTKGYRPAVKESHTVQDTIAEIDAFSQLIPYLLDRVDTVAGDRMITRNEMKRDLGFQVSALRLLEKTKQLVPEKTEGGRYLYRLSTALKLRILQPGVWIEKRPIRTIRKHANITTVHRDFWKRLTEPREPAA